MSEYMTNTTLRSTCFDVSKESKREMGGGEEKERERA